MVAAIPKALVEKYGHWADKIPTDVLVDLTEDQVRGRLQRAEDRLKAALGPDGDGDIQTAMAEAGEILAAPPPGGKKAKEPSVLKVAGITGDDMTEHGRWISRIPDATLAKMDRPEVIKRAQVAAAEYARTHSIHVADRILSAPAHVVTQMPMAPDAREAYRRGVREDLANRHARWITEIPDEILKSLDAAELLDRCEHAAALQQRGVDNPAPGLMHGYLTKARKVLRALPRAEVDAEVARLEKAALLADDRTLAQGYRDRAQQLRDDNPAAPVVTRPGVVGKALRPTPKAAPRILLKATPPAAAQPAAPKAPAAAPRMLYKAEQAPAAPAQTAARARQTRTDLGLAALEQALLMLKNRTMQKADGTASDLTFELLALARQAFSI